MKCQSFIMPILPIIRGPRRNDQWVLKSQICVGKLCFYGQLGPGLPPEKDYFKIGPVGVQLLSVKVSYLQYLWCFSPRRKEQWTPKAIFFGKLCFFGPWGSGLPPEKDCIKIGPLGEELSMFKVAQRSKIRGSVGNALTWAPSRSIYGLRSDFFGLYHKR